MVTVELAHGALIARGADGSTRSVLALHGFDSGRDVRRWMQSSGVYDNGVYRRAVGLITRLAADLIDAGRVL